MTTRIPWGYLVLFLMLWSVAAFFAFVPVFYILGTVLLAILLAALREAGWAWTAARRRKEEDGRGEFQTPA